MSLGSGPNWTAILMPGGISWSIGAAGSGREARATPPSVPASAHWANFLLPGSKFPSRSLFRWWFALLDVVTVLLLGNGRGRDVDSRSASRRPPGAGLAGPRRSPEGWRYSHRASKKIKLRADRQFMPLMYRGFPAALRGPTHTQLPLLLEGRAGDLGDRTFTPCAESENSRSEDHRLHSGNIKPLPASRILTLHDVIEASHVRLRLGKLRAVAFIRISAQRLFLGAHQPSNFVSVRLPAVHAGEVGGLPSLALVKKVSFIHGGVILAGITREGHCGVWRVFGALGGASVRKDPPLGPAIVGRHQVDVGLHLFLAEGLLDQLADGGRVAASKSQQGGPRAAQADAQQVGML